MNSRRKKLIVDPAMQWALIRRLTSHWLMFLGMLFAGHLLYEYMRSFVSPTNSFWVSFISRHWLTFAIMVAAIPVFMYDTLRMSNRFAGPLARLRESFQRLSNGEEVSDLATRKGDYVNDLVERYNELLERYRVATSDKAEAEESACESEQEYEHVEV